MDPQPVFNLLASFVGVLGSTAAWKFWERRAAARARLDGEMRRGERDDHVTVRDDLRERVASLETKLEAEYREKIELLKVVGDLKAEVAALRTKLDLITVRGGL